MSTLTTPALDAFWMPFTPNRTFKAEPRLVVSAQGIAYRTQDGREVLDGTSGLWCVGAGHRHPRVSQAMKAQIDVLDYASNFQVGHPGAFALSERIGQLAPAGMDRVFLVNSGSEACDTAMKIALSYCCRSRATHLVCRARAWLSWGGVRRYFSGGDDQ